MHAGILTPRLPSLPETALGYRCGYILVTNDLMGSIASIIVSYLVVVITLPSN